MLRRWLVVFKSHPAPPLDATWVEARGRSELEAIRNALKVVGEVPHPWILAEARVWPAGAVGVDDAARKVAGPKKARMRDVGA